MIAPILLSLAVTPQNIVTNEGYIIDGVETLSDNPIAECYAEVDKGLPEGLPVIIQVQGVVEGYVGIGCAWGSPENFSLRDKDEEGINVMFLGMTPEARIGPIFLGEDFDKVERAEFSNLGLKGHNDSFAVRQLGYVKNLVFNDFWIQKKVGHPQNKYESLMHLGEGWRSLYIGGYEARGHEVQHHCFYLKGGGETRIVNNELWGGNRTGVQIRPHQEPWSSPPPTGNIYIQNNYAQNFGWNHENPDGGGWISVWSSLNHRVIITGNTCTNARYSCLVVAQPVAAQNPYLTRDGYSHGFVGVMGNTFDNTGSQRACVSFTATRVLVLGPNNNWTSNQHVMEIDTWWSATYTDALPVRDWWLLGNQSIPSFPIHTWDYAQGEYREIFSDELVEHIR